MSAGLSGAMAARGVGRGDAVMTLVGSRVEWVLAMLACFRMGAVALPCNPQLRRKDLELRIRAADPVLCIGEERLLGELPEGVPAMTWIDLERGLDEDLRQEPRPRRRPGPDDPAVIIFTSGTTGDPRGVIYPQRYLIGPARSRPSTGSARGEGDLAWCTAAPGWSKSTRNVFIAPWLAERPR